MDGKIYLIGGLEPMENGLGTRVSGLNQMYDPATNTWTNRSPMPTSRNHAHAGAVNGKIYVLGGRLGAGNIPVTTNIDTVEEYDPATNLWGPIKERMPQVRSGGGWAVCNGKIYLGGGEWITREFYAALKALDAYDPATNTWEVLTPLPGAVHGNAMGIGNSCTCERRCGRLWSLSPRRRTTSSIFRASGGPGARKIRGSRSGRHAVRSWQVALAKIAARRSSCRDISPPRIVLSTLVITVALLATGGRSCRRRTHDVAVDKAARFLTGRGAVRRRCRGKITSAVSEKASPPSHGLRVRPDGHR